ncbi:MAG: YARHG domain-containing protein [Clostridia bacterium]|nr:YARHG domain-containing protein [Clostridia bacterium]
MEKNAPQNYYLIDYAFGNFLDQNKKSVVAFYDKIENKMARPNVEEIRVYEINNKNEIIFWGILHTKCCYYPEKVDALYKRLRYDGVLSSLGDSHHFGWCSDFNENGFTELMFLKSAETEEGATIEFWEFKDGKFVNTLAARDDICYIVNVDKKTKEMILRRSKYSIKNDDYESEESTIYWNSSTFSYEEKNLLPFQNYSERLEKGDITLVKDCLSEFGVASLNKNELRKLRNLIYAVYGYKFKAEDLKVFFNQFEWYEPKLNNVDSKLSEIDQENINLIKLYEEKNKSSQVISAKELNGLWQDLPIMASSWSETFEFKNDKIRFYYSQMDDERKILFLDGKYTLSNNCLNITLTSYTDINKKEYSCSYELSFPLSNFDENTIIYQDFTKKSIFIGSKQFFFYDCDYN